MHIDWNELIGQLRGPLRELRTGTPDVMQAFSSIAQAASKPNALDSKTKELSALAISVAIRCDDCIGFHTQAALKQSASRDEVLEALGMAIYMGAGPAVMYASHAIEAFDQLGTKAPQDAQLKGVDDHKVHAATRQANCGAPSGERQGLTGSN
jgi:AhpD family alkylhydroperoxidase